MIDGEGWFREANELWPGQAFALKVRRKLYEGQSEFQHVLVFESESYGNVLVLDGVIQATERDEFAYQEMICHVPLMVHRQPRRVLVVGGGDGGCVREVLKHPSVQSVDLVEIDGKVMELSKKYLPSMSSCLDDPRVNVHICDGFKYLADCSDPYDVIISDTSDPEGPAVQLFQKEYFELLRGALTDHGIVAMQASESIWLKINVLHKLQETCHSVFPVAKFTTACVPTYTSGQLGLIVCAKDSSDDVKRPVRECNLNTKYYTPEIHSASFVLPNFAQRCIDNS